MTTHVTVALDNITLRGVDIDSDALLAVGEIQNHFLEINKQIMSEHCTRLALYGQSAYIINNDTGLMELVDL